MHLCVDQPKFGNDTGSDHLPEDALVAPGDAQSLIIETKPSNTFRDDLKKGKPE